MQFYFLLIAFIFQSSYLSMLCYNFGVITCKKQVYEDSVAWLKESFEFGKGDNSASAKNQVE